MKIYILQRYRMYTFLLPKVIAGNYIITDYDERNEKRSLLNVEEENGRWVMKSNNDISILDNGKIIDKVELQVYQFYQILVGKDEYITLYIDKSYESNFIYKKLPTNDSLTIGCGNNLDIIYQCPKIDKKQALLTCKNGVYTIKNLSPNIPIYVNGRRVEEKVLQKLDVVFILGLRFTIYGENILINNINNAVFIYSSKLAQITNNFITGNVNNMGEVYTNFYEEKDYYWKTPVFQSQFKTLNLKISPPPNIQEYSGSVLLQMIPSLIMSSSSIIMALFSFNDLFSEDPNARRSALMSLLMCASMLFCSIIWPLLSSIVSKFSTKIRNKRRINKFKKYLTKKEKLLKDAIEEQGSILQNNNVSLNKCQEIIISRNNMLFSRNIENYDFLSVRLGVGTVPLDCNIDYQEDDFIEEEDKMLIQIRKIIAENRFIHDVPATVSLLARNKVAFISEDSLTSQYIMGVILQLVTLHSYVDLKLIILTSKNSEDYYSYIQRLPHLWSNDYSIRFFATEHSEAQAISNYLEGEFGRRKNLNGEITGKNILPYYLILIDSIDEYRNLKILQDILEYNGNLGFSVAVFDSKVANVPIECKYFVNYSKNEGACFASVMRETDIISFKPEFLNEEEVDLAHCFSLLANIPVKTNTTILSNLPDRYGFLEMYDVGKVEQLNVLNKWKNANIVNSLAAPIGIDATGNLITLDLHEKYHGPHGLIAGMTGSGKSEFIITYILSLAVNYSPDEVQFVLIDYKGGGLAGAFENRSTGIRLPHLVGTITNLDKAEMKRTLVSIESEAKRRQKIFNKAKEKLNIGTIDIYKYQKLHRDGKLEEPISHLFIICDEFAELKAQQPDFMEQLISMARIGRSLGVHLILATQKPSGVVDDQIWSNSKFKVCCKVQTTEDSNEMLHKTDAAYIKEAGRFYLQVGYDEYYILGQSAYSGMQYIPFEKARSKVDNAIDFVNEIGQIIRSVEENTDVGPNKIENLGEELKNVLLYIIDSAKNNGYKENNLWLPNIPSIIYLENIRSKYKPVDYSCIINPVIGEYDNPRAQLQGVVRLPITKEGNTAIIGMTSSGKTTLLSTLIYSVITTHDTNEVNFYIIDLGAETLKNYMKAPQVGDVLLSNDAEKIIRLLKILQKENKNRKKLFSNYGGSYESFCRLSGKKLPNILLLINGLDIFKEQFDSLFDDVFIPLTRDCSKNGITIIFTATTPNALEFRIASNFPQRIALQLLDPTDYYMIVDKTNVIPSNCPGRGLIKIGDVYEFQTCLIFEEKDLYQNLDYIFKELATKIGQAPPVPELPNIVKIAKYLPYEKSLDNVIIGLEKETAQAYVYNFARTFTMIAANRQEDFATFMQSLLRIFDRIPNCHPIVLNTYQDFEFDEYKNTKVYSANFNKLLPSLHKNMQKYIGNNEEVNRVPIIIFGYTVLQKHLLENTDPNRKTLVDLMEIANKTSVYKVIIVDTDNNSTFIKKQKWYENLDIEYGIWLGSEFFYQHLFPARREYGANDESDPNDEACVIEAGERVIVRYVK